MCDFLSGYRQSFITKIMSVVLSDAPSPGIPEEKATKKRATEKQQRRKLKPRCSIILTDAMSNSILAAPLHYDERVPITTSRILTLTLT